MILFPPIKFQEETISGSLTFYPDDFIIKLDSNQAKSGILNPYQISSRNRIRINFRLPGYSPSLLASYQSRIEKFFFWIYKTALNHYTIHSYICIPFLQSQSYICPPIFSTGSSLPFFSYVRSIIITVITVCTRSLGHFYVVTHIYSGQEDFTQLYFKILFDMDNMGQDFLETHDDIGQDFLDIK